MRDSRLNLIGRDLDDINREFQVLLIKIKANTEKDDVEKKHWNMDLDGWINWLESLKK